jgi:hypothetical protein
MQQYAPALETWDAVLVHFKWIVVLQIKSLVFVRQIQLEHSTLEIPRASDFVRLF